MRDYFSCFVIPTDAADLFIRLGFCPVRVRLTNNTEGKLLEWNLEMGNDASLEEGFIEELAYTGGGAHEVIVGDILTGATGGATAKVERVTLTSGTWAGTDAAGMLYLSGKEGAFESENLDEGANGNVCTVAADSAVCGNMISRLKQTDKGIKLVEFTEDIFDMSSDPSAIDPNEFWKANGIQITADVQFLASDVPVFVEAWRMKEPLLKATHDGGDNKNTYMQDASYDFRDAGVGPGWIVLNKSNSNYAFVGEVQKPTGQDKYCRVTLVDAAGNAMTAADVDDNDVLYLFPKSAAWYPLSDIGIMT